MISQITAFYGCKIYTLVAFPLKIALYQNH